MWNKMDVGRKYRIIYNDFGNKPVQKFGILVWEKYPLFKLDSSSEELNINNIIRAIPMDGDF